MSFLTPKNIGLILDCLVLLIILAGFLWGVKRGLKKSSIRFVFIILSVIIAFFTFPYLLDFLLNLKIAAIPGGSVNMWIESYITTMLGQNAVALAETIAVCKTIVTLLVGSLLFALLFFVLKLITWPIFALCAKQKKDAKKYRWWGGLIGLCQGFAVAFVLFIPLSGISDIADKAVVKYENTTVSNPIKELVPTSITPYLSVYEDSITNKVFGCVNADKTVFKWLTTKKVNGQTISATKEVDNIIKVYDIAVKYNIFDPQNKGKTPVQLVSSLYGDANTVVGSEPIRGIINELSAVLFDSQITKTLFVDAVNYSAGGLKIANYTKLKIADVKWAQDRTVFATSIGDLLMAAKPIVINNLKVNNATLQSMSLEQVGKALDGMKSMTLVNKIFSPAVYKLISMPSVQTVLSNFRISITEQMLQNTSYASLFKAVDNTIVFMAKVKTDLKNVNGNDIVGILDAITALPDELIKQMSDTLKGELEDMFPSDATGKAILPAGWDKLEINLKNAGNQEAIKGIVEILGVGQRVLSPNAQTVPTMEDVNVIINAFTKIGNMDPSLSKIAESTINEILKTGSTPIKPIENLSQAVVNEKDAIKLILEQVIPSAAGTPKMTETKADEILAAAKKSEVILTVITEVVSPKMGNSPASAIVKLTDAEKAILETKLADDAKLTDPTLKLTDAQANSVRKIFGIYTPPVPPVVPPVVPGV